MKRLIAFALALTLFAAPTVALAEDYNRTKPGDDLCRSVPGPSWSEYIAPGGLCHDQAGG